MPFGFLLTISAALCRGLIEAGPVVPRETVRDWISAALCRGLIEAIANVMFSPCVSIDFRGFMPRPH